MVAYSFKSQFTSAIGLGTKTQTVRAVRKRHARPGEIMQLYRGQRTKYCLKLADVMCTGVCPISVMVSKKNPELIDWIEIDGNLLSDFDVEAFAKADGFYPNGQTSRFWMGRFWLLSHGEGVFEGVLISWGTGETWGA